MQLPMLPRTTLIVISFVKKEEDLSDNNTIQTKAIIKNKHWGNEPHKLDQHVSYPMIKKN